jgi:hypothetical protein
MAEKRTKYTALTSSYNKGKSWSRASKAAADEGTRVHKELELWAKYRIAPTLPMSIRAVEILTGKGFVPRDAEIKLSSPRGSKYKHRARTDLLGTVGDCEHYLVEIKTTPMPHWMAANKYDDYVCKDEHNKYYPCFEEVRPRTLRNDHLAQVLTCLEYYAHHKKFKAGTVLRGGVLYLQEDGHLPYMEVKKVYTPLTGANELSDAIKELRQRQAEARLEKARAKARAKKEAARTRECTEENKEATGTRKKRSAPKTGPSSERPRSSQ